jgi:heme A synthase
MITGLLHLHSGLRYLVLLAGAIALGYAIFGWVTRRPSDKGMRGSASAFAGLLHLQILIGFVILVSGRLAGGIGGALIGHLFMMLFAAAVAQIPLSVMRRRPPEERSYPPHAISIVVALVLIWVGIASIGRGLFEAAVF